MPIVILRDIHEGFLSLENADEEQGNFATKIKNLDKDWKNKLKISFFKNNLGLLFRAKKKVLDTFKSNLFSIKNLNKVPTHEPNREPTPKLAKKPTKHRKLKLKLQKEFMNEIVADKKFINDGVTESVVFSKRLN